MLGTHIGYQKDGLEKFSHIENSSKFDIGMQSKSLPFCCQKIFNTLNFIAIYGLHRQRIHLRLKNQGVWPAGGSI